LQSHSSQKSHKSQSRLVVTDGYTMNPGDLSWDAFQQFGEMSIHERTASHQIVDRCSNAEIIITNKTPLAKETIQQLSSLKLICVTATGYNIVDIAAAREKNIPVCNVPAYGTYSVAQHTFALLLEITNHVALHAASVKNGDWVKAADWCYTKAPLVELAGKTLGIIGMGHIGQQVARIAVALGMKVIYYSAHKKDIDFAAYRSQQEVFREADFISLHCPLKSDNQQFVNKELIASMKPGAWIINTARGQLIHEQDLADALNKGQIGGVALDVLSVEPPKADNPLLSAKNCIITPHNAWVSREARERILQVTVENIKAFITGQPKNVVN
jgi:glycerate dehydrogenase